MREEMGGDARIVKDLGDGLMLWFADAGDAIDTGLRLQERFEEAVMEQRHAAVGAHRPASRAAVAPGRGSAGPRRECRVADHEPRRLGRGAGVGGDAAVSANGAGCRASTSSGWGRS